MKNLIRWSTLTLFSLAFTAAGCSDNDEEPGPNGDGAGGSGGIIEPDAGDPDHGNGEADAGDDLDSGDLPDADSGDETDAETEAGDDEDPCEDCYQDPERCGAKFDACMAIPACSEAYDVVMDCSQDVEPDVLEGCFAQFLAASGQEGQDLLDCVMSECAVECDFEPAD